MILGFRDRETQEFWQHGTGQGVPSDLRRVAMRKLKLLNDAAALRDLRVPPGNHLEALKGKRTGQHSIRINRQFRVCFVWREGNAHKVEIVDYH
ncbi:MAG: type II toxin-antitoxin system RelE/ParE family toxin [Terriglobia bacterium]